jgi:thymidylate kinase
MLRITSSPADENLTFYIWYDYCMIFITGAAAAGKSTVTKLLKDRLPSHEFDIHDIDESDKWTNDYEDWRDAKIEYWMRRSISSQKANIATTLCGIIYPEHVEASAYYKTTPVIQYFLLDAPAEAITARFKQKLIDRAKNGNQGRNQVKNVDSWLKRQIEISTELREIYQNLPEAVVIDTSKTTAEEVADQIMVKIS